MDTTEKLLVETINQIKALVKEELGAIDDMTKAKWQINANYNFTNFPENSHDGVVGVYKPTLHQLDSFNHEIKNIATISMIDTEEKDGENYIVLRIKVLDSPIN
jgi:hypothetical protein